MHLFVPQKGAYSNLEEQSLDQGGTLVETVPRGTGMDLDCTPISESVWCEEVFELKRSPGEAQVSSQQF